jgi:hypothetical protein
MGYNAIDVNRICLHGRMEALPVFSHANHGVEFYRFPLAVRRLSGVEDRIHILASRPLLEQAADLAPEQELTVTGEVRTFNNRSGEGSRLIISVFARTILPQEGEDGNRLDLTGTLCKQPTLRATPLGRTICDFILAVNRRYGRSDYLPCIAWGSLAHRCGEKKVGDRIGLTGRLQSRLYQKRLDEQTLERTAFEVSVMTLAGDEEVAPPYLAFMASL